MIGIGGPRTAPFNVIGDMPEDPHGHLTNAYLHGKVNWRVGSTLAAGTLQHEADYAAYRALHDTSDYDDACSDLDGLYGCQMALILDPSCLIGLTLMRSRQDGPCDGQTIDTFRMIARQAMRAVRVQLALGLEAADLMLSGVSGATGGDVPARFLRAAGGADRGRRTSVRSSARAETRRNGPAPRQCR